MWHYKIYANNAPLMDSGKLPGHRSYNSGTDATLAAESICEAIGNEYGLEIKVYSTVEEQRYTIQEFKNFLGTVSNGIRVDHIHHYLTPANMLVANQPKEERPDQRAEYVKYVQQCNDNGYLAISYAEFCELECATV